MSKVALSVPVGTHNLHDAAGHPTPFARLIGWTEAVEARVVEALPGPTWDHWFPPANPTLGVSVDTGLVTPTGHGVIRLHRSGRILGAPGVTPARHMAWTEYTYNGTVDEAVFAVVHMVNNSTGPDRRGHRVLRRLLWRRARRVIRRQVKAWRKAGKLVTVVGDLNVHDVDPLDAPHGFPRLVDAVDPARPRRRPGYDRATYTPDVRVEAVESVHDLGAEGSDHRRLVARFRLALTRGPRT